jgi:hypothetical protein
MHYKDLNFVLKPSQITSLTDALYLTSSNFTLENLRDSFSTGQLYSKMWLLSELHNIYKLDIHTLHHLGCWHGLLSSWIIKEFPTLVKHLNLVDVDPSVSELAFDTCCASLSSSIDTINKWVLSAEDYCKNLRLDDPKSSIVINTSCEHMSYDWVQYLPSGTLVCAQSNNSSAEEGHTNAEPNLDSFVANLNLNLIYYSGTLEFPMYKRFMVIGRT